VSNFFFLSVYIRGKKWLRQCRNLEAWLGEHCSHETPNNGKLCAQMSQSICEWLIHHCTTCRCSVQCGNFYNRNHPQKQKFLTTVYTKQVLSWRKEIFYFIKGPGLALTCFTSFHTHSNIEDCEGTYVHHKQQKFIRKPAIV